MRSPTSPTAASWEAEYRQQVRDGAEHWRLSEERPLRGDPGQDLLRPAIREPAGREARDPETPLGEDLLF